MCGVTTFPGGLCRSGGGEGGRELRWSAREATPSVPRTAPERARLLTRSAPSWSSRPSSLPSAGSSPSAMTRTRSR
eukprot:5473855-Prymnesium_polylepis.1